MSERETVPRGRHAPPLQVRQERQRRRLNAAAARVFARCGYADATAEAIAREAGMSKATFYEHFDNKEDCICALFDEATQTLLAAIAGDGGDGGPATTRADARHRYQRSVAAFLEVIADNPDHAQTLLVEIIGAGPRAMERRDRVLSAFADYIEFRNREDAETGVVPRLASPHDAFAIVGAVVELASRQIRTGVPADIRELEPVVERLIAGVLAAAASAAADAA